MARPPAHGNEHGGQFKYTFTYNDEGLRTSKTASGVTHKYVWEGSTLVSESWGNHLLVYLYDESGAPIGLQYRAKTYAEGVFDTYYFEKNLQGDIVAVYNAAGNKLGSYTYDAWGNFTTSLESTASSAERRIVNTLNPFRYRGYYYDTETGLYYLQSRYYNPAWGRFLNADGYVNANGDLIGFNMYAYCNNNPVMYVDFTGEWSTEAFIEGSSIAFAAVVTVTALAWLAVTFVAAPVGIAVAAVAVTAIAGTFLTVKESFLLEKGEYMGNEGTYIFYASVDAGADVLIGGIAKSATGTVKRVAKFIIGVSTGRDIISGIQSFLEDRDRFIFDATKDNINGQITKKIVKFFEVLYS